MILYSATRQKNFISHILDTGNLITPQIHIPFIQFWMCQPYTAASISDELGMILMGGEL